MTIEPKRKPTSFDVARLAGVSRSAVSRAFTPGAVVAEQTREKVFEAAETLGYRVNSLARGLQGDHSGIVGILASCLDTPIRARQVKLLAQALIQDGFRPMLVTAETPDDVEGLFGTLLGYSVAGVIATSDTPPRRAIEECRRAAVPVVLINRAETADWADRVISDPDESGTLAFNMLTGCGAVRLGVLEPVIETFSVTGRARAFSQTVEQRFGSCTTFQAPDQSYKGARSAIAAAGQKALKDIDGLFCATDLMALGALDAIRLDLGLKIPEDLQVVGFDNIEQAEWGSYALSTIRQDLESQTTLALQLLKDRMKAHDAPAKTIGIALQPVYRNTTRHVL
jgi:DNA-binding LacI/PurR family transcriptional regulator